MASLRKARPWSQLVNGSSSGSSTTTNTSSNHADPRDPAAASQPHPSMLAGDPREMLHLMRSHRGRFKGDVAFRTANYETPTSHWVNTYCFVNVDSASLRHEVINEDDDADVGAFRTLIPDLRGCTVYAWFDQQAQKPTLFLASADGKNHLHLRPHNNTHFNTWFAALLCWSPVRAKQNPHAASKKQHPSPLENPFSSFDEDPKPLLAEDEEEENMTLKRDKAILIDTIVPFGARPEHRQHPVTVILRGNGELSIRSVADSSTFATITLGEIPRSAIHRISKSAFDIDRVIAIYPHYAKSLHASSRLQPICISFSNKDLFEAWFILLRSSAIPELYGSKALQAQDEYSLTDDFPGMDRGNNAPMLRLEQSLEVRISKAKLSESYAKADGQQATPSGSMTRQYQKPASYYAEILLDEHIHGKTSAKPDMRGNLFWNETYTFEDLPTVLSSVSIRVRRQENSQPPTSATTSPRSPTMARFPSTSAPPSEDLACGEVSIDLATFDLSEDGNKTMILTDSSGAQVGEITIALKYSRQSILMEHEYSQLLDYLKDFQNDISLQITDHVPALNNRLAELFLNIYQASNAAEDWLMELVEEEIYGKDAIDSPQSDAEDAPISPARSPRPKRDSHAILLFRGTTILSKAMDLYMRRCGETYLEETIGAKLREIRDNDPDCEVDPSKIDNAGDMVKNWQSLVTATKSIWLLISRSAERCPVEMKTIFNHVRTCAQDQYGAAFNTIIYTSVSGFLFLRFFCAAVLNPAGFGLVTGPITPRTQRSFMLIAKSLQGLANMTNFANKESWMAPMDDFTAQHRQQFEEFVDAVCTIPFSSDGSKRNAKPDSPTLPRPSNEDGALGRSSSDDDGRRQSRTQNVAANERKQYLKHQRAFSYSKGPLEAVSRRLHPTAREGYLSVPALIDPARNMAALVDLWLASVDTTDPYSAHLIMKASRDDLARFHRMCLRLQEKTEAHLKHLDMVGEQPSMGLVPQKWTVIAETMEARPDSYWRLQVGRPQRLVEEASPKQSKKDKGKEKEKEKEKPLELRVSSPTNGKPVGPIAEEPSNSTRFSDSTMGSAMGSYRHGSTETSRARRSSLLTVGSDFESFPPDIPRGRDPRPGSSSRNSTGSDKSKGAKSTTSKKQRKKSPPRTKEENAMRKLGWM